MKKTEDQTFAIYFGERFFRRDRAGEEWWHAFLVLADETEGRSADGRIVQELHFNHGHDWRHWPVVHRGKDPDAEKSVMSSRECVARGSEIEILARWNHAIGFASDLRSRNILFSSDYGRAEDEPNCRTGAKDALTVMGLTYRSEFACAAAGTGASVLGGYQIYAPEDGVTLETLWARNEAHLRRMIYRPRRTPHSDFTRRERPEYTEDDFRKALGLS